MWLICVVGIDPWWLDHSWGCWLWIVCGCQWLTGKDESVGQSSTYDSVVINEISKWNGYTVLGGQAYCQCVGDSKFFINSVIKLVNRIANDKLYSQVRHPISLEEFRLLQRGWEILDRWYYSKQPCCCSQYVSISHIVRCYFECRSVINSTL